MTTTFSQTVLSPWLTPVRMVSTLLIFQAHIIMARITMV
jgi:hypothetical protein